MGSRRIFLSYAREDIAAVRDLHARLRSDGFRVWLDLEDVLPGQLWESAIYAAIQDSRACVIVLSSNAVTKTGYVQKEIRTALEMAELMPEGRVFIIPVRLAACDVPSRLKRWQWVDLYDDGGYERLKRSLRKHLASPNTLSLAPKPLRATFSVSAGDRSGSEPARINLVRRDDSHARQSKTRETGIRRSRSLRKPSAVSVTSELDAAMTVPTEGEISSSPKKEHSPREELSQSASALLENKLAPGASISNIGSSVDSLLMATLNDTTWHIRCRKCLEQSRWIRLRPDGMIEFRFGNDRDFRFEGDDTWRVESNQLIISWRSGFSIERFTFIEPTQTTALGRSSNVRGSLRITRLQ